MNKARMGVVLLPLLLANCGGDDGRSAQSSDAIDTSKRVVSVPAEKKPGGDKAKREEKEEPAARPAATAVPGPSIRVDHTIDEQEFSLRRRLSGLESLIVDLRRAGVKFDQQNAEKAKLEKQLAAMLGEEEPLADETSEQSASSEQAKTAPPVKPGKSIRVVHTQDEQEFLLKKQIDGYADLIADYERSGEKTNLLQAKQAKLEKQLETLRVGKSSKAAPPSAKPPRERKSPERTGPERTSPERKTSVKKSASIRVDHTLDEQIFELKKAIDGVDELIKDYAQDGDSVTQLERQKNRLEKKLESLTKTD